MFLQLRQNTGYMDGHWAIGAAGHVEGDESVFDAARREALEELDVTVSPEQLEPLCTMHRTSGERSDVSERVDFFFRATTWQGVPTILEVHKAADAGWFDLMSLPSPMVPHELAFLQAYRAGELQTIMSYGFDAC